MYVSYTLTYAYSRLSTCFNLISMNGISVQLRLDLKDSYTISIFDRAEGDSILFSFLSKTEDHNYVQN